MFYMRIFGKMSKILVLGDSMLDVYVYGNTNRINPESSALLLTVDKEETILWWAANVAHNLTSLHGTWDTTWLITIIGDDTGGKELAQLCDKANIALFPLFTGAPTTTKTRFVKSQPKAQLLRVDREKKYPLVDSHIEEIIQILTTQQPEFLIVSDYNKWIVDGNLLPSLKQFADEKWIKILVDTKPQNLQYFDGVYLIKPNFKEFCEMIGQKWMEADDANNTDQNVELHGKQFVEEHKTNLVVTRWHRGVSLITQQWDVHHFPPAEDISVFDVTGAGDTFIATLVYALDQKYSLQDAVKLANKAGWIVVRQFGTATITTKELGI
jgi:D-glycero-beta-D-manno-heptose-7-phosphate kinase